MFVSDEDDFIAKSDKPVKHATKKEHNLEKQFKTTKLSLEDTPNKAISYLSFRNKHF